MKFLIAGYGSIGRRHLRNLRELGHSDILLYRSRRGSLSGLPEAEAEITGLPVETDLRAALAHRPDAVIIANPTALHLDVAIPAAEQGCHILIEKPLAGDLDRIPALREAVRRGGGQFIVGFQFRFHPTLRQAATLLAQGAIGWPLSVRAHWGEYLPNWHPWEDYRQSYAARGDLGGGVLLTLCHPFDYLRMLLGEYEVVSALGGTLGDLDLPVEDLVEVGLRFTNRAVGTLHLDYLQQPPSHTLEVIGAAGTLRWDNATGALALFSPAAGSWEIFNPPPDFERNHLFLAELRHFIAAARGQEPPLCTLEDGVATLAAVLRARRLLTGV
jgi:predicted dehydrogenase